MDGFIKKFIKLSNSICNGSILTDELDKYVSSNSDKTMFKDAIKKLMEYDDNVVRIYAARYSYDYNIDKKKAHSIAKEVLRCDKSLMCRMEAKYIYDNYKRRYIRKITSLIRRKKI